MHSGKVFGTIAGDIAYDSKGDLSPDSYVVGGKKKGLFVLYRWNKGPDGAITYSEQ
jgi:hypothetical protein